MTLPHTGTGEIFAGYAKTWLDFFGESLDRITTKSLADFQTSRLTKIMRVTFRKERSALRVFLAWCVEQNWIGEEDVPVFPRLGKYAQGVRATKRKSEPVELSSEEVQVFLLGVGFNLGHRQATTTDRYLKAHKREGDRTMALADSGGDSGGPPVQLLGTNDGSRCSALADSGGDSGGPPVQLTGTTDGSRCSKTHKTEKVRSLAAYRTQSGREDLNLRPLDPQSKNNQETSGKAGIAIPEEVGEGRAETGTDGDSGGRHRNFQDAVIRLIEDLGAAIGGAV